MTKKYEWKKTLKKFGVIAVEVLILGLSAYITKTPELLYLVPFVEAARNVLKHRYNWSI